MEAFPTLPEWITLEHQVATILTKQEHHGWYFDEQSARELESTLRNELESTQAKLRADFPYVAGTVFTPKRDNQRTGYVKGVPFTRLKDFNPQSRDHISWILQTHCDWTPTSLTASGKAVIDETVLKDIGTDISLRFLRVLELTKQLGMISEGVNAWQKLVTTSSRIHHHCSVGCATHRASHRNPNLSQVPSDERFRRLFTASPNLVMVGADLSGIELRMLAHYLARYDGGRYADILLNGDIHQENADKIGISRRQVKTVTYAFLYGAGDQKIGTSFDGSLGEDKAKRKGKEIRKAFVNAIPGLSDLLQAVKRAAERGYVRGLDSRSISVDKGHVALNYLLQGSAAIIAKRWMVLADAQLDSHSHQLGFIHDELQYETIPASVNDLKFLLELTAVQAGEYYNLRLPIAAEAQSGKNWAEVH
jgi:DNA polymerase I-like protein with 3'-5' exonuclease and polymerase domains